MTLGLLDTLQTFPVTTPICGLPGELWRRQRSQGRILQAVDTLIAATAVAENETRVTLNVRDYPMPEVRLYRRTW